MTIPPPIPMTPAPHDLWQRLLNYQFEPPEAQVTFIEKLSRHTGWDHVYAERCILEYKRYIYLICQDLGMMVPSDAVDQVWHLHLQDTRAYWEMFCDQVLERKIHHEPSYAREGELDHLKHRYLFTLNQYHATFGQEVPTDIWPDVETRFHGPAAHVASPDIPKKKRNVTIPIFFTLLSLVVAGATLLGMRQGWLSYLAEDVFGISRDFMLFLGWGVPFFVTFFAWGQFSNKGKKRNDDGSGCSGGCSSDSGCGDSGCGSGCGGGCGGD